MKPKPKIRPGHNERDFAWNPTADRWIPLPHWCDRCMVLHPSESKYGIDGMWLCADHYLGYVRLQNKDLVA